MKHYTTDIKIIMHCVTLMKRKSFYSVVDNFSLESLHSEIMSYREMSHTGK